MGRPGSIRPGRAQSSDTANDNRSIRMEPPMKRQHEPEVDVPSRLAAVIRERVLVTALLAAFLVGGAHTRANAGWVSLPNGPVGPPGYFRHDDVCFVSRDSGWVVNGAGQIWPAPFTTQPLSRLTK